MPRGIKAVEADAQTGKPTRPAHLSELCSQCGQYEVHPDYTAWSCEHGTWDFADFADPEEPPVASDEDKRAAALAILGLTEEQVAAAQAPVQE